MNKTEFSKRLTELRISKGVSSRDMSLSLGQSASYINNIENGVNLPSMSVFFYICEYFNITPSEFFDSENDNPELLNSIMGDLKKLDYKQLQMVSGLIKEIGKK